MLAGVVLAYVVSTLIPVGAAAVLLVVLLGLLAGRWRQFGPDGWWIAITGVIVVRGGARDAVAALTAEVATTLRDMAESARVGWSVADASRWVDGARESARWNPRRRYIRRFDSPLAGRDVVDRLSRVSERVLQVSVLLANVAAQDGAATGDAELATMLEQLADAVEVLAENPDELAAALDTDGSDVRRLRDGAGEQFVRGACVIAVSDAVAELEAAMR